MLEKVPSRQDGKGEELGPRGKMLRSEAKLTNREVAKRSGISSSAISKIENNQLSPTYDKPFFRVRSDF